MKLQVNVADSFCERIDKYASDLGISRSAFCAMLIGQGVRAYDASYNLLDEVGKLAKARVEEQIPVTSADEVKTPSRARKTPSRPSGSRSDGGAPAAAAGGAKRKAKKSTPV